MKNMFALNFTWKYVQVENHTENMFALKITLKICIHFHLTHMKNMFAQNITWKICLYWKSHWKILFPLKITLKTKATQVQWLPDSMIWNSTIINTLAPRIGFGWGLFSGIWLYDRWHQWKEHGNAYQNFIMININLYSIPFRNTSLIP